MTGRCPHKHFADIQTVVTAWHHRRIAAHLDELSQVGHWSGTALERLGALLRAWAASREPHMHQSSKVGVLLLHRDPHVKQAQKRLHVLVRTWSPLPRDLGNPC